MPKSRDSKLAYQRRNERAKAEGFASYYAKRVFLGQQKNLSRAQAAGHARKTEVPASIANLPSTRSNWIANKIKEIATHLSEIENPEEDEIELFDDIVKQHNKLRRVKDRRQKDQITNTIIDELRQYDYLYDDDLDFTIGDTP